jgi:hypothetical protein
MDTHNSQNGRTQQGQPSGGRQPQTSWEVAMEERWNTQHGDLERLKTDRDLLISTLCRGVNHSATLTEDAAQRIVDTLMFARSVQRGGLLLAGIFLAAAGSLLTLFAQHIMKW